MIPEVGHFSAILALVVAGVQSIVSWVGAARGRAAWMAVGAQAARVQFALLVLAFGVLAFCFISSDFSVLNVARNSHSDLPVAYRFAATWGSHEGSLLLWTLMLSVWSAAVTWFTRPLPTDVVARVLSVLGAISVGFLAFMLFTSNPFLRLVPAAPNGLDLNPLLQDLAMVLHPPLLYMGYVGFSVVFAFAISALLSRRLDAAWARWSRPWTTLAWMFLTCGIALGSFWAYYELGWGGWWFWDPVENASFMPWLLGTALIHSLAVTDKRGAFKSWTVLLAIATFSLSLLGAFLSGLASSPRSMHSPRTRHAACFFCVSWRSSLAARFCSTPCGRAQKTPSAGFGLASREALLLSNNVLLAVATASVLLGTLYPLAIDVLGLGKLSVGPPYFNTVFVAVMAPAMFLLGVGPIARWRDASLPELAIRLRWAFAASVAGSVAVSLGVGPWNPMVCLGLLLAFWIVATAWVSVSEVLTASGGWRRMRATGRPRSYYGMQCAHLGVAVTIIGITVVTGCQTDRDLRMQVGDTVDVAGYTFSFRGVTQVRGPNYLAARAAIDVFSQGRRLEPLRPEKRVYNVSRNVMTETAIDAGLFRDLYVSLGEPLGDGAWRVRIQYKPFVSWIWAGAILMAIGGGLAVSDRRYIQPLAKSFDTGPQLRARPAAALRIGTSGARS